MTYGVWMLQIGSNMPDGTPIRFAMSAAEAPHFPSVAYRLIAAVEAETLDMVFQLTNTIDAPWWENPEVRLEPGIEGYRSLSVGDVVTDETGKGWYVDNVGWIPVVAG